MNAQWTINRRRALQWMAGATAGLGSLVRGDTPDPPTRSRLGLVVYDCSIRRKSMREQDPDFDLFAPLTFLKHCRDVGAGGMQAPLGVLTPEEIDPLRAFADEHQLFIEAIVQPPQDPADVQRFEREIVTASDVGVQAVRTTIIPGRRYERFRTLAEYRRFEQRGRQMLERAVPVLERHQVRLAVENHKDQRIDERIALFEDLDCEFVGACVDTGNSFALLDGACEAVEALAPFAFAVHLKDQALQETADGFLLGDIPLGQGSFDLKRMVDTLRKARPNLHFVLELITRDALHVPCLTDEYWSTLPDVPARDLSRTLRFVRENPAEVQNVSGLDLAAQVRLEDANIAASLAYARQELGL